MVIWYIKGWIYYVRSGLHEWKCSKDGQRNLIGVVDVYVNDGHDSTSLWGNERTSASVYQK